MEDKITLEDIRDEIRLFNFKVNWPYEAIYYKETMTIFIYKVIYDDSYPDDMDFTPIIPHRKLIKSLFLDDNVTKSTLKNLFNNVA